jgi:hypothetical protein
MLTTKWYRSKKTNMIHMTDEFPAPRTKDSSQCGQPLSDMKEMPRREVRRAKDHEFCRKCTQLLGLH